MIQSVWLEFLLPLKTNYPPFRLIGLIFDVDNKEVVVGGGLAAIAEDGEPRRYRGTLGEVGGMGGNAKFYCPRASGCKEQWRQSWGRGGGLLWESIKREKVTCGV